MYHTKRSSANKLMLKQLQSQILTFPTSFNYLYYNDRTIQYDPMNYNFDTDIMMNNTYSYFQHALFNEQSSAQQHGERKSSESSNSTSSPTSGSSSDSGICGSHHSGMSNSVVDHNTLLFNNGNSNHVLHDKIDGQRTLCYYCKNHGQPECLYTSHDTYDENGKLVCPLLKFCACLICQRAKQLDINIGNRSNDIIDDDDEDMDGRTSDGDGLKLFLEHYMPTA
ncbi:unnamed protein product [Didymodactylos carnosus]|uniref:Nanos-type domain-containing protein n=1 Tax=Didymodactylos carnosus TaxID=1234261 RepID=A0A814U8R4_9BILA|nr:unnamed protein product [Didymodactylos carnosus]CAF1168772.1 unnamed protein product [Didymodactylos carnosus]CAF3786752.1 unnamed protein product [Didymodactylos carnosus]CAF3932471.1 unnamed protein product [Didymodactylos carnosus]